MPLSTDFLLHFSIFNFKLSNLVRAFQLLLVILSKLNVPAMIMMMMIMMMTMIMTINSDGDFDNGDNTDMVTDI